MKALILAAGTGSRMGELTRDRPKCLIETRGKTLLDRQMAALAAAGPDEVGIVTGWQAPAFAGTGARLFHNADWSSTTMVDSVRTAQRWLTTDTVLVSYGDIVYTPRCVRELAASPAPLAISYDPDWYRLWARRFRDPLDDAETFRIGDDGLVAEIGGRPTSADQVNGQYMGLLKITPAGWAAMAACLAAAPGRPDMTALLARVIASGTIGIHGVTNRDPWCEIDSVSDLRVCAPEIAQVDAALAAG